MMNHKKKGFTLIEVLLALAVIAIALTALLKITSQNTTFTQRLMEKSIAHWVAMQGVAMIQLGLVTLAENQESTQSMTMAGQTMYWRVSIRPTSLKHMQQINMTVSPKKDGRFSNELIAYRYVP